MIDNDAIRVFMSYSHADEAMRDRLEKHLAMLKREGLIETWHDRRIVRDSSWTRRSWHKLLNCTEN